MPVTTTDRFRREWIEPARSFWERVFGQQLGRRNSKGWACVLCGCPFHPSKSKRSFFVNLDSGAFCCHGCGAKGDIVRFVMLRDKVDFKTACKSLGAWDDGHERTRKPVPTVQVRMLVLDYVIDGVPYRAEVKDEPRNEPQRLRRLYHEAAGRLAEIRQGDTERFENEEETQWGVLSSAWDLIQLQSVGGLGKRERTDRLRS